MSKNNGIIVQIFDLSSETPISPLVVCPNKLSALMSYKKFLQESEKDEARKVLAPYTGLFYFGVVEDDYNISACQKSQICNPKRVDEEINYILSKIEEKTNKE